MVQGLQIFTAVTTSVYLAAFVWHLIQLLKQQPNFTAHLERLENIMQKMMPLTTALVLGASLVLGGCASQPYPYASSQPYPGNSYPVNNYPNEGYPSNSYPTRSYPNAYPASSQQSYSGYGVVESVQLVQGTDYNGPGAGAVVGGVVGGLLGNQVGGGSGRTVATVAGALGGAIVGNQVEQNNNRGQQRSQYQIRVRLDNGSYQVITQQATADMVVGSRVRIENNHVYRY